MSFGTEYQYRTLPLLLAQPLERSRQWREKFVALTVATATVALIAPVFVSGAALLVSGRVPLLKEREVHEIALMVAVTILTTICSTGYWTMVARSIIGGLAFSAAAQFMVGVTVGLVLHKIYGDLPLNDSIITCVTIGTGLIYSAVFLWLGRRKFIE
jgi:ABC-type transport system involved in multi-copper enzyme maturation permease subunit